MNIKILPSLLAADFGNLADGALLAERAGADALHLDIMDGHFVPNLSMGPDVVAMAKRTVKVPLNVHLMLTHPDRYLDDYAKAGATTIQIHVESACGLEGRLLEALKKIKSLGCRAGIVMNPETNPASLFPYLQEVDELLCMSVHPGYGGQSFIEGVLVSLQSLHQELRRIGRVEEVVLMVDGGINAETAAQCASVGANAFVAGSSLYRAENMKQAILEMRSGAELAFNQLDLGKK